MNWDDIRLFLVVAEEGSFRQAALKTELGHSTLSRRIETLEAALDVKLLTRNTNGLALTPEGIDVRDTAMRMGAEVDEMHLRLFGKDLSPKGDIHLTVPALVLNHFLIDKLNEFTTAWPEIKIIFDTSLDVLNLSSKEADLAIRFTNQPEEKFIGRSLGGFFEAAYATKEYLEHFLNLDEKRHNWISPGSGYVFEAKLHDKYLASVEHQVTLSTADTETQMLLAKQGAGFAMLPVLMVEASKDDQLIRISDFVHRSDIWLLAHQDTRENLRMKLFRTHIIALFENHRAQFFDL